MKILLDHCVPGRLANALVGHEVATTRKAGWDRLRNGDLLSAAANRFDVLITVDRGMKHQHDLENLPLAVILIRAISNRLEDVLPAIPDVLRELNQLQPNTLVEIQAPKTK